ncbi:MAG: type II CAAX endopeptidase family protein [Luteolibacter sp.]
MIQPGNPYRTILRREYPEPLIALLAFVLGIWLWDHYCGKTEGYAPGTEEIALVKIDRDLRLADAMADDPPWLRWLAEVDMPVVARRDALKVLQKLTNEKSISPRGIEAFAIVTAEQDRLPLEQTLNTALQGQMISDFGETSQKLANHQGTWWQAKLIETWEKTAQPAAHWRQNFGEDCLQLKTRAVMVRSAVWLLGFVGLFFLPSTLCRLRNVLHAKVSGYGGSWPLTLGLMVFLVTTLAWIGFSMTLELGIDAVSGLPPFLGIFLDSSARVLPTLIALGLLFRRPSHAVRVLGLNRPITFRTILGLFALLMILDQILRVAFNNAGSDEPGGGLSHGDAGAWGLAFMIISACVVAPLAEETLYRGVLFRSFWNRLGVIPAAILSSVIFAALHFYDGYGLASVGIFGFTCALLYASSGSLTTVIALHMLYNSSIKIPEWIVYHAPLG